MDKPAPIQIETDDAKRTATVVVPPFEGKPDAEISQMVLAMAEAQKEWVAKGYTIRYRTTR